MKNLVKSILVASTVSLFATSASAVNFTSVQVNTVQDTIIEDTLKKDVPPVVLAQNEVTYEKVATTDVPQAVTSAVAAKYAAYTVDEAFKGSDKTYKLVLKNGDAKLTVIYNESGEFVKEENASNEGSIMLV